MVERSRIIQVAFHIDVSLRDLYLLRTSEHDWQTILSTLRVSTYPLEFRVDEERRLLPDHLADIFSLRDEHEVLLRVDPERLGLNCHFYIPEEIECDLDPKDYQSDEHVSALLAFIRTVGQALRKGVVLTAENDAYHALFRFDPSTNEEIWFLAGFRG